MAALLLSSRGKASGQPPAFHLPWSKARVKPVQESKGLGGNAAEEEKAGGGLQISGARERETEVEVAERGLASREGNTANGAARFIVEGATPAHRAQIPTLSSGSTHFTIPSYGGLGGGLGRGLVGGLGGGPGGGLGGSLGSGLGGGPSGGLDGSRRSSSLGGGLGVGRDGSLVINGTYFQTSSKALTPLSLATKVHVEDEQQHWRGAEEGGGDGVGVRSVSAAVSKREDLQNGRRRRRTTHPESDSESGSGSGKSSPISTISVEHDGSEAELDSWTEVETGSQSRSELEEEEEEDDHGSKHRHSSAKVGLVAVGRSKALRTTHLSSSQRTLAQEEEQEVHGEKHSVSGIRTRSNRDSSSDQSDASSDLTDTSNNLSPILEDTEEEEEEKSSSPSEDEEETEEEQHLENESAD